MNNVFCLQECGSWANADALNDVCQNFFTPASSFAGHRGRVPGVRDGFVALFIALVLITEIALETVEASSTSS
jgi:hypothetical protein